MLLSSGLPLRKESLLTGNEHPCLQSPWQCGCWRALVRWVCMHVRLPFLTEHLSGVKLPKEIQLHVPNEQRLYLSMSKMICPGGSRCSEAKGSVFDRSLSDASLVFSRQPTAPQPPHGSYPTCTSERSIPESVNTLL